MRHVALRTIDRTMRNRDLCCRGFQFWDGGTTRFKGLGSTHEPFSFFIIIIHVYIIKGLGSTYEPLFIITIIHVYIIRGSVAPTSRTQAPRTCVCDAPTCSFVVEYVGHNYVGHNYIGHNYVGHKYLGHDHIGHDYIVCVVECRRLLLRDGSHKCRRPKPLVYSHTRMARNGTVWTFVSF